MLIDGCCYVYIGPIYMMMESPQRSALEVVAVLRAERERERGRDEIERKRERERERWK
jgi:hypothetical protein